MFIIYLLTEKKQVTVSSHLKKNEKIYTAVPRYLNVFSLLTISEIRMSL